MDTQATTDATFATAGVAVDAPGVDQMRTTRPQKTEKHPKPYAHRYNITQAMQYNNDAAGYHLLNWINSTIYNAWKETALPFAEPPPFAFWHNAVLTIPTPLGPLALEPGDWVTYIDGEWGKCSAADFPTLFFAVVLPEEKP
jgi:hypothetical protein